MRFVAVIIRILIIAMWVNLMYLSWWTPATPPFCSGISFILVWIYLQLQSVFWPKSMLCPLFHGCKSDWACKKENK